MGFGSTDTASKAHSAHFHLKMRVATAMCTHAIPALRLVDLARIRAELEPVRYGYTREATTWDDTLLAIHADALPDPAESRGAGVAGPAAPGPRSYSRGSGPTPVPAPGPAPNVGLARAMSQSGPGLLPGASPAFAVPAPAPTPPAPTPPAVAPSPSPGSALDA